MKKRTRLLALLLCLIMMFTVAAPALFAPQAQAASTSSSKQTTIKLNKTKASVYNGKTLKLKVSGTKKTVTWSTSNKAIATVSKKGVVTPKKPGTVKIKAQVAGKTLTCKVTVKSPLRVSKQELTIEKGKTAKIKVALHLDDGDVNCKIADRSITSC